jgi:hypothetical protein
VVHHLSPNQLLYTPTLRGRWKIGKFVLKTSPIPVRDTQTGEVFS